jgi:hypothetical protein
VKNRVLLGLVVALAGLAAVGVVIAALAGGGDDRPALQRDVELALDACSNLGGDAARGCYERAFTAAVRGREDPRPAVAAISEQAWKQGVGLLGDCHGIMHTVGRTYARERKLTLATLMDFLPASDDPGCSAGFAHGMVTAIAPDIDPQRPGEAARVCGSARTRYQRYSCVHGFGHAFSRISNAGLEPALHLCRALGERVAADCAQGAYHDYWFAVEGLDDAPSPPERRSDPREVCATQPREFVRACWYRGLIERRPDGFALETPADLDGLCSGLTGLQRAGCITGASVIGPPDPVEQLALCAGLADAGDAAACVRGTKVQNLLGRADADFVGLVERCAELPAGARDPCRRWLGRVLAVVTDGAFARDGCPRLRDAAARRACAAGAARADEALETFS